MEGLNSDHVEPPQRRQEPASNESQPPHLKQPQHHRHDDARPHRSKLENARPQEESKEQPQHPTRSGQRRDFKNEINSVLSAAKNEERRHSRMKSRSVVGTAKPSLEKDGPKVSNSSRERENFFSDYWTGEEGPKELLEPSSKRHEATARVEEGQRSYYSKYSSSRENGDRRDVTNSSRELRSDERGSPGHPSSRDSRDRVDNQPDYYEPRTSRDNGEILPPRSLPQPLVEPRSMDYRRSSPVAKRQPSPLDNGRERPSATELYHRERREGQSNQVSDEQQRKQQYHHHSSEELPSREEYQRRAMERMDPSHRPDPPTDRQRQELRKDALDRRDDRQTESQDYRSREDSRSNPSLKRRHEETNSLHHSGGKASRIGEEVIPHLRHHQPSDDASIPSRSNDHHHPPNSRPSKDVPDQPLLYDESRSNDRLTQKDSRQRYRDISQERHSSQNSRQPASMTLNGAAKGPSRPSPHRRPSPQKEHRASQQHHPPSRHRGSDAKIARVEVSDSHGLHPPVGTSTNVAKNYPERGRGPNHDEKNVSDRVVASSAAPPPPAVSTASLESDPYAWADPFSGLG